MTAEYCAQHGHVRCDCREVIDDKTFSEVLAIHNAETSLRRIRAERDETDYEDEWISDDPEVYDARMDDDRAELRQGER